jgi:hypothetical protein
LLSCCLRGYAEPERRPEPPRQGAKVQSEDDGKTILTKAIHAHGEVDKLARWSKGYVRYKASVGFLPPGFVDAVLEDTFDLPGHFKRVIRGKIATEEVTIVTVHNDGKGWVKKGDAEAQPNENRFTERSAHPFADLCDFSKACGADAKLTRLPDEKLGDHDAAVVNAKTPAGIDVDLFIDKQSALVIGTRKRQAVAGSEVPVTMIVVLEGQKTFQGGVYPTTIRGSQGEKLLVEATIIDLKFLNKVEATEFKKP